MTAKAKTDSRRGRSAPASPRSWIRANTVGGLDKVLRAAGHDPAPLFADHGIDLEIPGRTDGIVPLARLAVSVLNPVFRSWYGTARWLLAR